MQPLAHNERYPPLDVLRGLALYGVLLINLLSDFRVSLAAHIIGADGFEDTLLGTAVAVLIEFKAFTLFAFLFGAGVAVQAERIPSQRFLIRRFLILLGFGLLHLYIIWNGDILTLYAVCGLLLIPLLRLSPVLAAALAVLLILVRIPVPFPDANALRTHAAEATRIYSTGGFTEILAFRWRETKSLILPLLVMSLPRTLGVMLLGMAAWRSQLLTTRRSLWLPIFVLSALIGAAGSYWHIDNPAQLGLAFAYGAAVLLWFSDATWLAAAGRMALTNYLTQSIVFGFVFYSYGLGLFGRVGVAQAVAGGTAFYLAQIAFSRWWLCRFRFGPFEWLWRSLTYGRRQPFRTDVTHASACSGASAPAAIKPPASTEPGSGSS